MTAINAVKDDTVIVFIDGSNLHLTPIPVQHSYASPGAASGLPIVAVFDQAIEKEIGILGYKAIRSRDGFKDVKAKIAALQSREKGKQTSSKG
ncbi:MAG: hypothetical protein VXX36_09685 [Verrucomicrobiota bacterium]|nr:hypothetical protein [Verrucomicrobiota bacterium]